MKELNSKITYVFTMFFILSGLIVSMIFYNKSINDTNALSKVIGKVTNVTYKTSTIKPTKVNKHTRFIAEVEQDIKFTYTYEGKDLQGELTDQKAISKTRHQKEQAEADLSNMQLNHLFHEGDDITIFTDGKIITSTVEFDTNIDSFIGIILFSVLFLTGIIWAFYKKHNEHIPSIQECSNLHNIA